MDARARLSGLEVLLVEDEEVLAASLQRLLTRATARVTIAPGLATARELLRTGTSWDVVLLDQSLPDGDGLEILETLEAREHRPALVATSGNLQNSKRSLRLQSYGAVLLPKPFDADDLWTAVNKALGTAAMPLRSSVPPRSTIPPAKGSEWPERDSGEYSSRVEFGAICLELVSQTVTVDGARVDLQPTQFRILAQMLTNPGRPIAISELVYVALRGAHSDGAPNIRFQIHALRRRLGRAGALIETSAGGYGVGLTAPNATGK